MTVPRAVLDACVLYPSVVREALLGVAARGLIAPVWSPRILEEWARTADRRGDGPISRARIAAIVETWPEAMSAPDPAEEARVVLPDPSDAHVVAAGLAADADLIVTFNLRDFPRRALSPEGMDARHPDAVLADLWDRDAEPVEAAVTASLAAAGARAEPRSALKRARLPMLGKRLG
jgi:hypothetical protein